MCILLPKPGTLICAENRARNGGDSLKHAKFIYLKLNFLNIPMESVAFSCNTIKRTISIGSMENLFWLKQEASLNQYK